MPVDQSASVIGPLKATNSSFEALCEVKEANKEEEEIIRSILFPPTK